MDIKAAVERLWEMDSTIELNEEQTTLLVQVEKNLPAHDHSEEQCDGCDALQMLTVLFATKNALEKS